MKKQLFIKGFTLVELLVVIAIIAILASIVLVSLNGARGKTSSVRILSSIRQIRTTLESNFLSGGYADIIPNGGQVASIGSGPGAQDILILIQDIGKQNNYNNAALVGGTNVDLFTDGNGVQVGPGLGNDTGVAIFTSNTSGLANDYAIYATTTQGYVCTDSSGNTKKDGIGSISTVPLDANGKVICQ